MSRDPKHDRKPTWQCPRCKARWTKTPTGLDRLRAAPTCPMDGAELVQVEKRSNGS